MAYIYDLTDTWNAGGTTFNAIKMNVTDSASAAGSKLVTLQTNGTEHFSVTKAGVGYFSSDGLFGLSTASSSRRLRIYGCTATAAASSLQLMTSTSGTGVSDGFTLELDGNEAYVWNYETANIRFGTANAERMRITSAGELLIGRSSASGLGKLNVEGGADFTGGNVLMCRDTGNVGIGTSSPAQKLSVNGNIVTTGEIALSGADFIYSWAGGTTGQRRAGFYLDGSNQVVRFYTAQNEVARIDSSGNVGIGTSSPAVKLEVASANAITSLRVDTENAGVSANNYSEIALADNNAVRTWWRNVRDGTGKTAFGYNDHLAFLSDAGGTPTERARIDSSGNLLVGTTSAIASGRISVQSTGSAPALVGRSASDSIQLYTTQTSGTSYFGYWVYNGTNVGSITSTGTTTAYNTSSDARLKHDIVDAPEASSLIDAIRVRSFKWNADNSEQRYGMIAQELLEVAPEAVSHDPDDEEKMMGIDYSKLVPMLVKAIQELTARVAQLEGN